MILPAISTRISMTALRAILGIIFISHGFARLYYSSVTGFGGYLSEAGFPLGTALAWIITIGEIISGILLAIGYLIKSCVIFHTFIIITGIILVHIPNGWFVVGHGTGGVEYSLLILVALTAIYSYDYKSGAAAPDKQKH